MNDIPAYLALAATQAEVVRGLALAAIQNPELGDLRDTLLTHARKLLDVLAPPSESPTGTNVVKFTARKKA